MYMGKKLLNEHSKLTKNEQWDIENKKPNKQEQREIYKNLKNKKPKNFKPKRLKS